MQTRSKPGCDNEFPGWKFCYLNIIWAERYSLRNSCMCHLIDTKEILVQRQYIQNIWKIFILKSNRTMMVESSPMWMGMDLLVWKYEKESLSSIMWFEAPESIKSDLYFEVLAMRAWPFWCCGSRSCWSLLRNLSKRLMWFLSRREVASSSFFFMQACSGWNPFPQ